MGIKLMVEIMDHWQDAGLTPGERADLLVLAENAKDSTRETFGPVHEDYILKRVGKKAAAWRVAISALKAKGVLEYAIRDGREMSGQPGRHAVYRFPVLCPEAPHDGLRGQCTRLERVSPQLTHSEPDDEGMGYPTANALDGMGYPTATERVSPQLTPTPPISSGTTSSTPADPSAQPATEGGGGGQRQGEQPDRPGQPIDSAETFLQSLPGPWAAGRKTARELAPLLLERIAQQGWRLDDDLTRRLSRDLGPVRTTHASVLRARIDDLPKKPSTKSRDSPNDRPMPPWCEHRNCDEITRRRTTEDHEGHRSSSNCRTCHPDHYEDQAA